MNVIRIFIFVLMPLLFVSCASSVENAATAQTANTPVGEPQTNAKVSQTNASTEIRGRTFFKTFIVNNSFQDDSEKTADAEHRVEFKNDSAGISVYIDDKKKAGLDLPEADRIKVSADFRESNGVRYFVLIVASAASGVCGDAGFAVVKIDEDLNARISKPNENACQGEFYPVSIEMASREKVSYRQISIGKLKFNLEKFDWLKEKAQK